jgi:hypothetical protein
MTIDRRTFVAGAAVAVVAPFPELLARPSVPPCCEDKPRYFPCRRMERPKRRRHRRPDVVQDRPRMAGLLAIVRQEADRVDRGTTVRI